MKMNEFKYKYQCVASTNLHQLKETATSQSYAAVSEGFAAQIAGLVEMFLMELYRRKLCQLTSSIKSKIRTHLAHMHEKNTACQISGCPEVDQDENESYSMGHECNQENKDSKENLSKMSALLPVYQMLQNISPHCCDMSRSSQRNNIPASRSCEVHALSGEAAAHLQLEEHCSAVPTSLLYSMDSSESKKSKDEAAAQSVHLGLCRVSSVRTWTLAGEIKTPEVESRCKNYKNQKKVRCGNKGLAHPVKDACALKLGSERTQHFCNACNIALKLKDAHKIHEKGHDVDRSFKCIYCRVAEWYLMENNFKSHKRIKEIYQCLICESVLKS